MKIKSTKRALIMSALSLLLCMSMLVGTTFAWFTDSVTSGKNTIQSGNLDVELEYSADGANWLPVTESTNVFGYNLWEPGYTKKVLFRVTNKGSLALKYQLTADVYSETAGVNKAGESFLLSKYLYTAAVDKDATRDEILATAGVNMNGSLSVASSNLLEANAAPVVVALAIWMPTSVGNEANHNGTAPKIEFGVNLLATQAMKEEDSFGNDYDKDADFPTLVGNAEELAAALANGDDVMLSTDVVSENKTLTIAKGKDVTIDLNGNDLVGVNTVQGTSALIKNSGTLTITGNGTISVLAENPDTDWNPEGFPTYASNTISNSGNLTIEDGVTIENKTAQGGASYAIDNYAGATLTVNGGVIRQSAGDVAIRMNTASATAENKVTINGGTISGRRAIWIQLAGSSNATAPKTTLEINGGDLSGTQMCIYSYSYGNSFANTNVTINGGTFTGNVEFGGGYKGDTETVTVTGGTFNGEIGRWDTSDNFVPLA